MEQRAEMAVALDRPLRPPRSVIMSKNQTAGRDKNVAIPPGQPDAKTSQAEVKHVGEQGRRRAGPDGPDAREVGDTFKS
jgi:hypothetical protein